MPCHVDKLSELIHILVDGSLALVIPTTFKQKVGLLLFVLDTELELKFGNKFAPSREGGLTGVNETYDLLGEGMGPPGLEEQECPVDLRHVKSERDGTSIAGCTCQEGAAILSISIKVQGDCNVSLREVS